MKTIKGDLVKLAAAGEFNVVVHGCNCFNTMGAGVALQLATQFPEVRAVDALTLSGDRAKLGKYTLASIRSTSIRGAYNTDALLVVNAYTQYDTANSPGDVAVDYGAVYEVFNTIVYNLASMHRDVRIGIPMIGAGLAGGNWDLISLIIEDALSGFDHNPNLLTLVEYDG